jgi:hypothetical protein
MIGLRTRAIVAGTDPINTEVNVSEAPYFFEQKLEDGA